MYIICMASQFPENKNTAFIAYLKTNIKLIFSYKFLIIKIFLKNSFSIYSFYIFYFQNNTLNEMKENE